MKMTTTFRWWGYRHINKSLHLRRYLRIQDMREAEMSPFVEETFGPFRADTYLRAMEKLRNEAAAVRS